MQVRQYGVHLACQVYSETARVKGWRTTQKVGAAAANGGVCAASHATGGMWKLEQPLV